EVSLAREGCVAPDSVHGDPNQRCAMAAKLGKELVVERQLVTAHRAPIGRIKDEYYRPAAELDQTERLIGRDVQPELRCSRAGAKNVGAGYSCACRCHSSLLPAN